MTNKSKPVLRFGKAKRLTLAREFARMRNEGTAVRGTFMTLSFLSVLPAEPVNFRAGFITSKRIGNAVVRNRVRRRLREAVRRHQHEVRAAIWLVLIAKTNAAGASYALLEDEYLRLARRASILAS